MVFADDTKAGIVAEEEEEAAKELLTKLIVERDTTSSMKVARCLQDGGVLDANKEILGIFLTKNK